MKTISSFLLFLLPVLAFAKISLKENQIQPFTLVNYPTEKFIEDYANAMGKTILVNDQLRGNKYKVNFTINNSMSKENFSNMFLTVLSSQGLTAIEDESFTRIISTRDVRFAPTEFYTSDSYPIENRFMMVFHRLKYTVVKDITRNMRPFMSRYGRIIDFNDAHSIVISDNGTNIKRLLILINSLDNKEALDRLVTRGPEARRKKKRKESKGEKSTTSVLLEKIEKLEKEQKEMKKQLGRKNIKRGQL